MAERSPAAFGQVPPRQARPSGPAGPQRQPDPRQLNASGLAALARNEARAAAALFAQAAELDPGAVPLWLNVAKAQRLLGDDAAERAALERALALDALDLTALIRRAELLQRTGALADATVAWSAVLGVAPPPGQRSPALEALLDAAQAFVSARNAAFAAAIDTALAPAKAAVGTAARRRVDAAIDAATGRRRVYRNVCAGLHFPFLPADEYFDRAHFPWLVAFEAHTPAIRAELLTLLDTGDSAIEPYVAMVPGAPPTIWSGLDRSLDWSAYYLWQYGEPVAEALVRCPATAAALAEVPMADIPGRAPTAFFSILRPRTRIPPHTGVTNTRAIVHLPLVVPPGCGFRVGGETRAWVEGEALVFDDTIEHEAWNDSDAVRAVLIVDVWNPYIAPAEQSLLRDFFAAADASDFYLEPAH